MVQTQFLGHEWHEKIISLCANLVPYKDRQFEDKSKLVHFKIVQLPNESFAYIAWCESSLRR